VALGKRVASGIDLGGWSVKLAVVEAEAGGVRLIGFGSEPLPIEEDSGRPRPNARREALEKLLDRSGMTRARLGRVALSIGGDAITVRQFSLPNLTDQELVTSMPLEARRHVPLPPETEIAFSYQVLARDPEQGRVEILLGACPRSTVREAVKLAEDVGLSPDLVDAAPLAGLNAILHAQEEAEAEVGFLDIGAGGSTLSLYREGGFLLSRRFPVGGEAMTSEIAERLGVPVEKAEAMKRGDVAAAADVPKAGLVSLVEKCLGLLAAEVRQSIAFFDQKAGRRGLGRLALGGGGARLVGLAPALERQIGIPVRAVDPVPSSARKEALPSDDSLRLTAQAGELAVAFGLTRWWEP
jgi:type IV pilus assembly protein PilM